MERDALMRIIGENLRKYREANGLTQEELSEKVGISTSFYANIERGAKGISIFTLRELADVLQISADFLLFEDRQDTRLQNIQALLKNQPEQIVALIEQIIRLLIESLDSIQSD